MSLEAELVERFVTSHPRDAARALAAMRPEAVASVLVELGADATTRLLPRMPPLAVAIALRGQDDRGIAALLEPVQSLTCGPILRAMGDAQRDAVLAAMSSRQRSGVESLLRFPEGTVGSLMDPVFVSVHRGTPVERVLEDVRSAETRAVPFIGIVDDGKLAGVVELDRLLRADPDDAIEALEASKPQRLSPTTSWETALANPDWMNHPSLPVTDAEGRLVGILRYETMRLLERRLVDEALDHEGVRAGVALAELYGVGLRGVASLFASLVAERSPRGESK